MRANIYGEELTTEVQLVKKTADTGVTFYGVRFFLKSPEDLHHRANDDDRSAVTFWIPWTKDRGHNFAGVANLFTDASDIVVGASQIEKDPVAREGGQ